MINWLVWSPCIFSSLLGSHLDLQYRAYCVVSLFFFMAPIPTFLFPVPIRTGPLLDVYQILSFISFAPCGLKLHVHLRFGELFRSLCSLQLRSLLCSPIFFRYPLNGHYRDSSHHVTNLSWFLYCWGSCFIIFFRRFLHEGFLVLVPRHISQHSGAILMILVKGFWANICSCLTHSSAVSYIFSSSK